MRREAIILAGGAGTRAGAGMPKQLVQLLGIPMLWWSVMAFHDFDPDTNITLVMNPACFDDWDIIYSEMPENIRNIPFRLVCGGPDRTASVENGIMGLPDDPNMLIAVHDAARPVLSQQLLQRVWDCASRQGSAVPCCAEVSSLRRVTDTAPDGTMVTVPMERAGVLTVQTPQVFRADMLRQAYARRGDGTSFTDDASLVQQLTGSVAVCDGDPANIKVTTPVDFAMAEALLRACGMYKNA